MGWAVYWTLCRPLYLLNMQFVQKFAALRCWRLHYAAVADACRQLNERLAPYKANLPGATFKEIVNAAYLDRCDLSAHGFYATPDITGAFQSPA